MHIRVSRVPSLPNASLAPVVDRFLPDMFEKLPEATFGERYKYALDMQNSREQPVAKSQLRPRYQQKDQLRAARI